MTTLAWDAAEERDRRLARFIAVDVLQGMFGDGNG